MSKWPVEEMGRNSVIPSIIPSRMTAIQSGIRRLDEKMEALTSGKSVSCHGKRPRFEIAQWGYELHSADGHTECAGRAQRRRRFGLGAGKHRPRGLFPAVSQSGVDAALCPRSP